MSIPVRRCIIASTVSGFQSRNQGLRAVQSNSALQVRERAMEGTRQVAAGIEDIGVNHTLGRQPLDAKRERFELLLQGLLPPDRFWNCVLCHVRFSNRIDR